MGCRPKLAKPQPDSIFQSARPHSLQYLSLRNSSPKVNQLLPFSRHPQKEIRRYRGLFFVRHPVRDLLLRSPLLLPLLALLFVIPSGICCCCCCCCCGRLCCCRCLLF